MLVDWFTLAAQVVNFTILVWLLKRLLYKRVLKAMDERQEALSKEAADAQSERERAQGEAEAYTEKLAQFEADYTMRMKEAEEGVLAFRSEKLSEVSAEIREHRCEWNESLERQRHDFVVEMRKLIGNQVCETARKLVSDLGDASLEQQVLRHFVDSFASDAARREAISDGESGILISTTFPVEQSTRAFVEETLAPVLPAGTRINFEQESDATTLGVVLRAGNHRLEWNIDSYADQLTLNVERALFSESSDNKPIKSPLVPT